MIKMSELSKFCITLMMILFAAFCISTQQAYAHAPQNIELAYDKNEQTLKVTITHKSAFGFHYINSVVIKKNGVVVSTSNYENQPDPATFNYTYNIAAGKGDTLEVTAICNLSGSRSATLAIE
ncbi:MAG TPA: hypothetical protein ENN23_03370 [Deltaproteobacteria bacterium]|nr:hypothetical protein [Deltaproteobacteria bacterium]